LTPAAVGWCPCGVAGSAGLAGRVGELRAVSAVLARESDAAGMLVVGEAGVGKSRLIIAAAADVAHRGDVLVFSGWCLATSGALPFLPLLDVLRALGGVDEGRLVKAALAECPPYVTGELLRLMPELGDAPEHSGPVGSDDGWRRQRLLEALRRLLAALGQRRRVAVVIEDVHCADPSTLELLEYLLAPGRVTGVPVLLTCRSEEAPTQSLVDWLDRMQRNSQVCRLDLPPLSQGETAEQVGLLLGQQPSRKLAADIYARSEGNPFFTEQLVAARTGDQDDAALPTGLRSLLISRTGRVTGTAREVLAVLAVAARPLDEASVARVCARPQPDVRDALRDLLARRLLRRPDRTGVHQLRHALLAEAISGELLPGERRELHARVAALLTDRNDPSLAAQIAEHYAGADRAADELRWRVIAGRHADAVYAPNEAAGQWQRAIALSAGAPIDLAVEGLTLAELYGAAEDALELSGNTEAAKALAEEALVRLADADPASRAEVLRRAGDICGRTAPQRGLDLLHQALALYEQLPASASAGHVRTLRDIRAILSEQGRQVEAAEVIDRAAALADRTGDRSAHLEILGHLAWHEMAAGHGELALERIRTVREQLTAHDEPFQHMRQAITHTDILLKLGRLTEVEAVAAPALQIATAYGMDPSSSAATLRWNVFEALTELGSMDSATGLIDPVSQGTVGLSSRGDYHARATLEMLRGNLDAAQQRWIDLHGLPPPSLAVQVESDSNEVELQLWRGAPGAALEQAHALLVRSAAADQGTLTGPLLTYAGLLLILALRACADLAEAARISGDYEAVQEAKRHAGELSALRSRMTPDPFTPGPLRPTATADGATWQAEWNRLRGQSDVALWEQTATAWDALARPHRAAYARWRQAEALLSAPQGRAAAAAVLRTAAHQAVQHAPLSTAIGDLARRARIELAEPAPPVPHDKPPTPTRTFGLTDREVAVLRLLAEGRSNPEIAAALFISPKTASVHVTHILRKLGVTTRVQAATVAERAGLLAADPAPPVG
jgi:DNA-binding CsgD family transcriptional regulator